MRDAALRAGLLMQGETRWNAPPLTSMLPASFLRVLAGSFLAGGPSAEQLSASISRTLGQHYRWIGPLAKRYVQAITGQTRPRRYDVIRFLKRDRGFQRAWKIYRDELFVAQWLTEPGQMRPVAAAASWNLPILESAGALAAWLGLNVDDLLWFADLKGIGHKQSSSCLRHYHYRLLTKQSGHIRLIEAPKHRLKDVQWQILFKILDQIPPHPSADGFVKGRSIQTFVAPHVGQHVVLRMDLQDFFPSVARARVQGFFRTAGYPDPVADLLGAICTTTTPGDVWRDAMASTDPAQVWDSRALYSRPHLPQGAPTSPALANLCSYRLDCRLSGLAESAGAVYSRYADDLAFSGGEVFARKAESFSPHVTSILKEEGFAVHHRKTRIMRRSVRQQLVGLVTNERINVRRTDFDRLKAILTNCVRTGPDRQNWEAHPRFRSHLEGRVAFIASINLSKGKRLRTLFERISWE
jgi:RNA-directed DNA polymerase